MLNIIQMLNESVSKAPYLVSKDKKLMDRYYLSPSSATCYTDSGQPIGACIKQIWLDKKDYPISNPVTAYNQFTFDAGKMWEDWLIQQYKKLNIYIDSNVKLVDNDLSISCEIDILHHNPEDKTIEVTECKTYNGANIYAAKDILGDSTNFPKPKDQNLLQCVKYLLVLSKYNITKVNLIYLDKSVSKIYNNKQFTIYLQGEDIYYDTYYKNELITIKEERFNVRSILEKDQIILELLKLDYVPNPDYHPIYTEETFEKDYKLGNITKKNYESVKTGKISVYDLNSYQCNYCRYFKNFETGESTCLNTTNETK